MEQVAENYVKIRNTFRYLLINLPDFEPERHAVGFADLLPLDQYMVLRTADFSQRVQQWYAAFEFHRIYHQLNQFCTVDLSNFYLDVLKDRLYTSAPNSPARRSAQTAVWRIAEALVRLVAPILSFTADEVWSYLPQISGRPASVHLAYVPQPSDITGGKGDSEDAKAVRADFDSLMAVRNEVMKVLEVARKEKLIGSGLEAAVTIHAADSTSRLLDRYRNDLRFLLIVSGVEVKNVPTGNGNAPLRVEVSKAPGKKCERCWNYSVEVGKSQRYPTMCERCLLVLEELEGELPE
jgi:isoleucyl-tRNA synthetase